MPHEELDAEPQPLISLGSSGLKEYGGVIDEEFLRNLRGRNAIKTYNEMISNSPAIAAALHAIKMLIGQVDWRIEPADESDAAKAEAEDTESALEDMSHTFDDLISEALSMIWAGFAPMEITYKIRRGPDQEDGSMRSKFSDGKFGWRKVEIRAQDTLDRWVFDDDGGLDGMIQNNMYGSSSKSYGPVFIPIEKMLLFRVNVFKNNPEGKALALGTVIPTLDGWTTMGDVKVGDKVYDDRGRIRYVVAKSEVFKDRTSYEIRFSSGEKIVADENHEWSVTTGNDRTNGKEPRILTTKELFEASMDTNPFFSCGVSPTLDCPDLPLPVDPYILGYWLGDGTSSNGGFSVCDADRDNLFSELERAGYKAKQYSEYSVGTRGKLGPALRAAGVLGDKHIPLNYLRSSAEQRLALLQGLMDSDGHTPAPSRKDRASSFSNANISLVRGVAELVSSLGGRPTVKLRMKAGRLGGKINGHQIVAKRDIWEARFFLGLKVHRLQRKADNQPVNATMKCYGHMMREISKVENVDTVCIEVDSPSHLFLVGEGMIPTHNSMLRPAVVPYWFTKRIQEFEAIGIERNLAGMPVMEVPSEILIPNASPEHKALRTQMETFITQVRMDERYGGLVPSETKSDGTPSGWKFKLMSAGSRSTVDTDLVIKRYRSEMLMLFMAQFLTMGTEQVGSFSLSSNMTNLFGTSLGAIMDSIAIVINRFMIPRRQRLNGVSSGLDPKIEHGDIEGPELDKVAAYITALAGVGVIGPNPALERRLLEIGDLPQPPDEETGPASLDENTVDSVSSGGLSGDHVKTILEVNKALKNGQLDRDSALATIAAALGIDLADAEKFVPVEVEETPKPPAPSLPAPELFGDSEEE